MSRFQFLAYVGGLLLAGLFLWFVSLSETLPASAASELIATEPLPGRPQPPPLLRPIPEPPIMPPWPAPRVSLEVLVNYQALPTVHYRGRTYLPVPRLGMEYSLRITNNGPRRIAAIVSVDGLSVLNGQPASADHPGYIVAPFSHIVIKGWQRGPDTAAAFRFEERENSYAWKVGRPDNIGVIGLIAIEELGGRPPLNVEQRAAPAPAPATGQPAKEVGATGTGLGRDVGSSIYSVPFLRGPNRRTITLYYDTADALRRAGIPVDWHRPIPVPLPRGQEVGAKKS